MTQQENDIRGSIRPFNPERIVIQSEAVLKASCEHLSFETPVILSPTNQEFEVGHIIATQPHTLSHFLQQKSFSFIPENEKISLNEDSLVTPIHLRVGYYVHMETNRSCQIKKLTAEDSRTVEVIFMDKQGRGPSLVNRFELMQRLYHTKPGEVVQIKGNDYQVLVHQDKNVLIADCKEIKRVQRTHLGQIVPTTVGKTYAIMGCPDFFQLEMVDVLKKENSTSTSKQNIIVQSVARPGTVSTVSSYQLVRREPLYSKAWIGRTLVAQTDCLRNDGTAIPKGTKLISYDIDRSSMYILTLLPNGQEIYIDPSLFTPVKNNG